MRRSRARSSSRVLDEVVLLDFFDLIDGIITNFQANGFKVSNTGMACNLPAEIARATQPHLNNPSQFGDSLFCSPKNFNTPDADQTLCLLIPFTQLRTSAKSSHHL
jgi:hypothetical protein